MDNFLQLFKTRDVNKTIETFKLLFTYPYWNYVTQAITYTRYYEEGLMFVEKLFCLLNNYKHLLTENECEDIDISLIYFKLVLLDKSDRWMAFVDYFNQVRDEKCYTHTYSLDIGDSHGNPPFKGYLIKKDKHYHYVHFLYQFSDRLEVIQRKIKRIKEGKKTDHLKHHSQSELSEEEIIRRFEWIFRLADEAIKNLKK